MLFESSTWKVHFIEVDTGWLFGRDVLVPAEKIARVDLPEGGLTFALTKKEIENSPEAETARGDYQYEELFPYYGLGVPWAMPPDVVVPTPAPDDRPPQPEDGRPRLIFARDLDGYELDAKGERAGAVRDVLVDLEAQKVTSLAADLGGIFVEDMAEIGLGPVVGIDTEKRVVHVELAKDQIDKSHRLSADDLLYVFPYIPPIM